ncbi:MAG: DUF6454 family protein [Verrucomicrobiia bacterium]
MSSGVLYLSAAWLVLGVLPSWAADRLQYEELRLPSFHLAGQPARAHTQGLEIVADRFYVTARLEDSLPRRALLLRTERGRSDWDVWDITPSDASRQPGNLDHPGGMQSDGKRLWIPLAESRRNGRSLIRAFPLQGLTPGGQLKPDVEVGVDDHIGALAVSRDADIVLGASWDTETVYVWDCQGHLQRTLTGPFLRAWGLGSADGEVGLAVQDWKILNREVFASGLLKGANVSVPPSRLLVFESLLTGPARSRSVSLPELDTTELGREGMAIDKGVVYFLPEDLGDSNRLFRIPLPYGPGN